MRRAGSPGGRGGAKPELWCSTGDVAELTPLQRLPLPSIPVALRLIRAGELLRAAAGGDRRGERSLWLPGSY